MSLQITAKVIANIENCGYNVTIMASITTKLVKDGNSIAVRIPKAVLVMSGLEDEVKMDVTQGQIIITSAKSPRADWQRQIDHVLATNPNALALDPELDSWDATAGDGLD